MVYSPVQCEAFGWGTVDSMIEMTAGKSDRVTANTMNTDIAWTQICLKILQYGGETSRILTFTDALTAEGGREKQREREGYASILEGFGHVQTGNTIILTIHEPLTRFLFGFLASYTSLLKMMVDKGLSKRGKTLQ